MIPQGLTQAEIATLAAAATAELVRRAAKEKDILTWGRLLFPEKFYLRPCSLHETIVENRLIARESCEAPRGHAKTTVRCFLIPIFQALEEPRTFRYYLNVQSTQDKALRINASIRVEFERNDILRMVYGDLTTRHRWNDSLFALKNGVFFGAASTGQSVRGINVENMRPDYIIVDDPYEEDDINNYGSTKKKNQWIWSTLYPSRAKGRRACFKIQGTAVNRRDIFTECAANPLFTHTRFQAITDEANQKVLWPELNTFQSLMDDKRTVGSLIFAREMQNERRDEESSIIKSEWVREYDPAAYRFDKDFQLLAVEIWVDPSVGATEDADCTGAATVLKVRYRDSTSTASFFLIFDVMNKRLSMNERFHAIGKMAQRAEDFGFKVSKVKVEAIGAFADFAGELGRKTGLPVELIKTVRDKVTNLENRSHFFESGRVLLNKNISEELKDVVKYQLTNNTPDHDDVRDAILLGLEDKTADMRSLVYGRTAI